MTIAPHVEMIPPIIQMMRDIPTEPLSLKIVAGVEKILGGRQYKMLGPKTVGQMIPSTNNLVHNQRDSPQQPNFSALEDIGFDDLERLILIARVGRGDRCLYACICIESLSEDKRYVDQVAYVEVACYPALTSLCRYLRIGVNKHLPQRRA